MAFPSYEDQISTATANLNFNERYSFETIARVAKNLSYHLKSKIAHHVAVNRVEDLKKLSARLDRLSTIIATAVTPKFAAAPTHSGNAIKCPRAACYGAMHVLADCPPYRAEGGCRRCASPNHLARNCPL
jgi:hypothetical protein